MKNFVNLTATLNNEKARQTYNYDQTMKILMQLNTLPHN